jgi:hypothetical protein
MSAATSFATSGASILGRWNPQFETAELSQTERRTISRSLDALTAAIPDAE